MKRPELPPWHKGHCLPHAVFFAVDQLMGHAESLVLAEWCDGYDENRWMWPGTAVKKISQHGLRIRVFDNDVDLPLFGAEGLSCISTKYGKIGEAHFLRHFELQTAIEDTKSVSSNPLVTFDLRQINNIDMRKAIVKGDAVCLLNLDFRTFHDEIGPPIGHYVIPIETDGESISILDPAFPRKVFRKTISNIRLAQAALGDETISMVVSKP